MADALTIQQARARALARRACGWRTTALLSATLTLACLQASEVLATGASRDPNLRDPMQAPAGSTDVSPGGDRAISGDDSSGRASAVPHLSSIRRPAHSAPRAQLDGQWLNAGQRIGEWRIQSIGSASVVLQSVSDPRDTRLLDLHSISIRPIRTNP